MYKLQIMFKKSADDELINAFKKNVLVHLEDASEKNLEIGEIVGAKLMEEPYHQVCELSVKNKDEMNKLLTTSGGKKFNRSITSFMSHVSLFFIEYGG